MPYVRFNEPCGCYSDPLHFHIYSNWKLSSEELEKLKFSSSCQWSGEPMYGLFCGFSIPPLHRSAQTIHVICGVCNRATLAKIATWNFEPRETVYLREDKIYEELIARMSRKSLFLDPVTWIRREMELAKRGLPS